jgi:hypothetical protein
VVITSVLRRTPEATDAVVAAAIEEAPEMVKTIVSAAVFATGEDQKVIAVADRVAPESKATVRSEVAVAKARRALSKAVTDDFGTPGNTNILITTNITENVVLPTQVVAPYAGAAPGRL